MNAYFLIKLEQARDLWQEIEPQSDLKDTANGAASGLVISMLEKHNLFHLADLAILELLMLKWMGLFLKKNNLLRCWDCFFSILDWDPYIASIVKTASNKIGTLICSMKFPSSEIALYLYKSIYNLGWNTVVMTGLVLLAATWIS